MNEFEWLRQTRALNQAEPPARDLWPVIEQRLQAHPRRRQRRLAPWAMAASIGLVSLLAASLGRHATLDGTSRITASATTDKNWQPSDPRLTGAAVELQAARTELASAIHQAPDAAFLQRLLTRTRAQELRLRRFGAGPG
jgi:hypothetical protein